MQQDDALRTFDFTRIVQRTNLPLETVSIGFRARLNRALRAARRRPENGAHG
jgi:hypothetical protein